VLAGCHITLKRVDACLQESTADLDAEVVTAVDELKTLKASLLELEGQMEKVTGVPRNKEAFREAVVRPLKE
jgi:hypothetical protein